MPSPDDLEMQKIMTGDASPLVQALRAEQERDAFVEAMASKREEVANAGDPAERIARLRALGVAMPKDRDAALDQHAQRQRAMIDAALAGTSR